MRKLLAAIVCFSVCGIVVQAGGGKDGPKVDGAWNAIAGISDGKKLPQDIIDKINLVVTIKEGKYKVTVGGKQVEAGTYKLDTKTKPNHLDLTITEGDDKGKTQLGIMKLEGDQMSVAFAKAGGKDRPKNFDGGDGIEVTILKRGK